MKVGRTYLTNLSNDYDFYYNDWLTEVKKRSVYSIERNRLPKEFWINEDKKAVVLKWYDNTITKVKPTKEDKFDARYGFLIAYFQKHSGMTKTQANKYLDNILENKENK